MQFKFPFFIIIIILFFRTVVAESDEKYSLHSHF